MQDEIKELYVDDLKKILSGYTSDLRHYEAKRDSTKDSREKYIAELNVHLLKRIRNVLIEEIIENCSERIEYA